jgi:hypothetical protein
MESKILLIVAAITSLIALFSPVTEPKYTYQSKDKLHIEAEKYLHELEAENIYLVDSISHL